MMYFKDDRERAMGDPKLEGAPEFIKDSMVPIECLKGAGRFFATVTVPVGSQIPNHPHIGEYEVYTILSGGGDYNDNGTIVKVGSGDSMYCPDGEMHGLVNTGTEPLVFIGFVGYANPEKM